MNEQKLINQMIQEGNAYTYVEYMRKENFKSSLAAKAAFEHAIFRPSVIYKYATNDIRDAIINELNKEELDKTVNVNNLLMALAQNELSYFKLSKEPVSDIYCNEFERSAIGGFPAFINDAEYADCPICNKKMKHFAQLCDKDSGAGGTIYVQICTDCQTVAVLYQQT